MNQNSFFENIHFEYTINTINTDFFPDEFPVHWHKYVEIVTLPIGTNFEVSPLFRIQQTEYRLAPGDLLFFWPGELHEIVKNTEHHVIGLQFSTSLFLELPEFGALFNHFRTFHHIKFSEFPDLAQTMGTHLKHMVELRDNAAPFHTIETLISLYEMFIAFGNFVQALDKDKLETAENSPNSNKIKDVCKYITEHYEKDLTLDSIADYAGFSPYYFSRIFKKETGYNFVEYVTSQRIKQAQILLADSSLSITDVAYQAGFKSISTFNRVFLREKNCSPREYRKYYLGE